MISCVMKILIALLALFVECYWIVGNSEQPMKFEEALELYQELGLDGYDVDFRCIIKDEEYELVVRGKL